MKNFKRLLAVALSTIFLLCSLPLVASADYDTVYSDTPLTSRSDFLWGVQLHTRSWSVNYATEKLDEQLEAAAEMGVNLIRVDGTAPTQAELDKIVRLCNAHGMKVLMIAYFDYSFTEACSTAKATEITSHVKGLCERYNGLNGYGKIDFVQLSNEVDCAFINTQVANLGGYVPDGSALSWYNDSYMTNVAGYFKAAVAGVNQAQNKPQTIINFSYKHYGFLKGLMNKGIDFDIIGHDWYSDMYEKGSVFGWGASYYKNIGNDLNKNFDKPILICEGNMRQSESLVAKEDSDKAASGHDDFIKCIQEAYANSNVMGFNVYEFCDEPERQSGSTFNEEAHFGITKYVDGKLTPKQIYYRLRHLIRGDVTAETVPALNPKYKIIDSKAGQLASTTVPADTSLYPSYKMATNLGKNMNAVDAKYLEFDIYASADTNNSFWIWLSNNQDSTTKRAAWQVPLLKKGWNHIIIDITTCSRYEKGYNKSTFNDFNSFFFEGAVSTISAVTLKVANMVIADDDGVAPNLNNTYFTVDSQEGILNTVTVPAGANMYRPYWLGTKFAKAFDATKGEYFEFDMYSSVEGTNPFIMWLGSNYDSTGRAAYALPSLKKGWNHIEFKLSNYSSKDSRFNLSTFTNFATIFCEGIISTNSDVTLYFANPSITIDIAADEVPENTNMHKIVNDVQSVDLYGTKTNTTDNRYFLWEQYNTQGRITPAVDIYNGEFIEFDYFSTKDETVYFALGTDSNMGFYDVRSAYYSKAIKKGWNHICAPVSAFATQHADTVSSGTYNPSSVNGIVVLGANSQYVRLTNFAVTTDMPDKAFNYTVIDSVDGLIAKKFWDTDTTDIYGQTDRRMFISLGKSIDITNAQYLEFDIYADNSMQDLTIWLCNALDGAGRIRKTVKFSELVTAGKWNHIVLDISSYEYMEGSMDKTNWNSVFFQGDPNASDIKLNVKIANMGISKDYPNMSNDYDLVGVAINGIAPNKTANTVPAGANFYNTYQMWNTFAAVDVTNADFIELDIYASAATENTFAIWSATDGAAVRGKWRVPVLNAGWNHVVIDLRDDFMGGNGGFTVDSWTSWSGYFFEGVPSSTNAITFRVANVAVTKDWNSKTTNYKGELISVYNGYDGVAVAANTNLKNALTPITLPVQMNLEDIDYVEFNIYVLYDGEITFNMTSAAKSLFPTSSASYTLPSLHKGWNFVSVPVSELTKGVSFDETAVKRFYFSGIISETNDAEFTVEDIAVTSKSQTFKIGEGDYNVDNAVDMLDLVHAVNSAVSSSDVWFANVAELEGCKNGIIDALDISALRKLLFASF